MYGSAESKGAFSDSCTPAADAGNFNIKLEATLIGVSNRTTSLTVQKHAVSLVLGILGNQTRGTQKPILRVH